MATPIDLVVRCSRRGKLLAALAIALTLQAAVLAVAVFADRQPGPSSSWSIDQQRGIQWTVRRGPLYDIISGAVEREWQVVYVSGPEALERILQPEAFLHSPLQREVIISEHTPLPERFVGAVKDVPKHGTFTLVDIGFPFRAHLLTVWNTGPGGTGAGRSNGVLQSLTGHARNHDLPSLVNPRRLAGNIFLCATLAYATINLAGFAAARARRRRGVCVRCAYPTPPGALCPECGAADRGHPNPSAPGGNSVPAGPLA